MSWMLPTLLCPPTQLGPMVYVYTYVYTSYLNKGIGRCACLTT